MNKALFDRFKVPYDTAPIVYVVSNIPNGIKYEKLEDFIKTQSHDFEHNKSM